MTLNKKFSIKDHEILTSPLNHIILLFSMCLLVYCNTLHNPFELDDFHAIVNNPEIRYINPMWRHFIDPSTISVHPANINYRPLLPLTLSFTYALFGYKPLGYHLFNIFFQIVATIFLYLLFCRILTFRKEDENFRIKAFFGASIFALHPLSGFCVSYICARDNIMMLAFTAICLLIYLKMRKEGDTWYGWIITILFFFVACLSKSMGAMIPFLVLEFETTIGGNRIFSKKTISSFLSFFLPALAGFLYVKYFTLVMKYNKFNAHSSEDVLTYLMTQFKLHLFHYLRNFVWPFPIRGLPTCEVVHSITDIRMLLGFSVILASLIIAFYLKKKSPVISFCIFAYWTMFIPTSSFIPIYQYVADRWMYPSLPFICLLASILLFNSITKPRIIFAGIIILYFSISCLYMNTHWKSPMDFYLQCARYGTDEIGYLNLGLACRGKDDVKAKYYYEKSLEKNPHYYLAYINLAFLYISQGQKDRGLEMARKGIRYTPESCKASSYYWYGKALNMTGHRQEAFKAYKIAIDSSLTNPDLNLLYDGAWNAQSIKKYNESLEYTSRIHRIYTNYGLSRFISGWCYQSLGDNEKAIAEYIISIKNKPDYPQTYANMGYALMELKRYKEGKEYFEKYLKLKPGDKNIEAKIEECVKNTNK